MPITSHAPLQRANTSDTESLRAARLLAATGLAVISLAHTSVKADPALRADVDRNTVAIFNVEAIATTSIDAISAVSFQSRTNQDNIAINTGRITASEANIASNTAQISTMQQIVSVGPAVNSTQVGVNAHATSPGATAIGNGAVASGSTAVGAGAMATGANSAAFGMNAQATGADTTALGENSTAAQANTTAIGQGAATVRANQVSIGNTTNTYTLSGVSSTASLAGQTGPVQILTTDANGNIAGDGGTFGSRLSSVEEQSDDAVQGVALAIAMTGSHLPQPGETFRLSMNLGHYEDKSAFSASGAAQITDKVYLTGGIGVGLNKGNLGGRIGVSFGW